MITKMSRKEFEVEIIDEFLRKQHIYHLNAGHDEDSLFLYDINTLERVYENEEVYEYLLSLPPLDDRLMREIVTMARIYGVEPQIAKCPTIQVLYIQVDKEPQIMTINNTLEDFQRLVGGNIEVLRPFKNKAVVVIANEEARIDGREVNRPWLDRDRDIIDVICGDFFVCYAPEGSEDFCSLRDYQILHYGQLLNNPLKKGTPQYDLCKLIAEYPPHTMLINL